MFELTFEGERWRKTWLHMKAGRLWGGRIFLIERAEENKEIKGNKLR